ncbi:MAG TPA: glycosyl hydrolase family 28-related protein, partial [Victivallales bacterium]|nr:glycosyl hydrolase family 28-related protein [Victivallales bacterium]
MKDGKLNVILNSALERNLNGKYSVHDLSIEIKFSSGKWQNDCIAYAYKYNSKLNNPEIKWLSKEKEELIFSLDFILEPDLWVEGEKFLAEISLKPVQEDKYEGTYKGLFKEKEIHGKAFANFAKKIVNGGKLSTNRIKILDEFINSGAKSPLYDFSYAGLKKEIKTDKLPIFNVEDFGAKANSGTESRDAIQAAVDAASSAGGGIVFFPPGEFDFSVSEKMPPVFIEHSNIIIRGSGSGYNGTILCNHRPSDSPDPSKIWLAGLSPAFFVIAPDAKINFLKEEPILPTSICEIRKSERGEKKLQLKEKKVKLNKDEIYLLRFFENENGSLFQTLTSSACSPAKNYVGKGKVLISQLFEVEDINEDLVYIDSPSHWTLTENIIAEISTIKTVNNVIIENLRMKSDWESIFVHHKNSEHDNGWDHIKLRFSTNCIVRNIVHDSTTTAVSLHSCKNCLIENNIIIGNLGHNGFSCSNFSTNNLFQRCHAGRQMHALSVQGTTCGNVFFDCNIDEPGGIDFHGGTNLDNLFDCISGGVLCGGGSINAVPPRHCKGLVFWNWQSGLFNPYNPTKFHKCLLRYDEMPGFIAVGTRNKYNSEIYFY